jgi:hypothetical protein
VTGEWSAEKPRIMRQHTKRLNLQPIREMA